MEISSPLRITENAEKMFNKYSSDRLAKPAAIRVGVHIDDSENPKTLSHSLIFEDIFLPTEEDYFFKINDLLFITDKHSAIFLNGVLIDFLKINDGSGFVFGSGCESAGLGCSSCGGGCHF